MTTTPVLFVSGAGLPAWIWDDVRAELTETSLVAPRPRSRAATVTDHAHAALDAVPDGPFTVVAHSAGGVVATELTHLAPGRVTGLVAISAVIPRKGGSFTASLPYPNRAVLPLVIRIAGTRPPASAIRTSLASDLDEDTVQRLITDIEPESRQYFTGRVSAEAAPNATPSTRYLLTTDDKEMPAALQHRFAHRLGIPAPTMISAGHLPMLSHPRDVISTIREVTADPVNGIRSEDRI